MPVSFSKFEEQLYAVGAGKDGLVIDVRENGGGNTADHLLTALTQPVHAITVPRGGAAGLSARSQNLRHLEQADRRLVQSEQLQQRRDFQPRHQDAEARPAGRRAHGRRRHQHRRRTFIMDVGVIRVPFRGWFLRDSGEDMELNGAVPDHILWPQPGQMPRGEDVQLAKAIEVLQGDVRAWKQHPRPALRKATERPANGRIKTAPASGASGPR